MAARKQADTSCMFCGDSPCTCEDDSKKLKKVTSKKKLSDSVSVTPKSMPKEKRPTLVSVAATAQVEIDQANASDLESEREALTALFKAGFLMERVGDPRGFESVRPMLKMNPVDIDISIWKMRRRKCQSTQSK